ncbi:hypothetical protein GCM10023108_04460 [Saccharopolyspora hordei]
MWTALAVGCSAATGLGIVMVLIGLGNADKVGSSVGGVFGLLSAALAAVSILQTRRATASSSDPAGSAEITNTVGSGTTVRSAVQSGTVGDVAIDQGVIAKGNARVYLTPPREDPAPLPPPHVELCLGRDREVAEVVAAWMVGRAVAAVGGPGMGKSTVLGHALTREEVEDRYGARRYVVSCDGAPSAGAVIDKLAQTLGITSTGADLRGRTLKFLHAEPCVLVLDNFETVLDGDYSGAVELLRQLRSAPDRVALGLGYRGSRLPHGIANIPSVVIGRLPEESAAELFQTTAGRTFEESELTPLLRELDGVPLAIVLLASLAGFEDDLGTLRAAWQAKRTDLLQHGTDRASSLPVSLELSWDTLSTDARATLSLAAELPDGWPTGGSSLYLSDELVAGVPELSRRALLHTDDDRQRCLAPVRQHVRTHHPAHERHLQHLYGRVCALASRARDVGGNDGAAAVSEVLPEFANVVEVTRNHLDQDMGLLSAVPDLLEYQRFSGLGNDELAHAALALEHDTTLKARITSQLAELYSARSDNQRARHLYGQAQQLYQKTGDLLGQADCLLNLGEIAFIESDNNQARNLFQQAQPLYQQTGDLLGQADCLLNLGKIAFIESDNNQARNLFQQAQPLYQQTGDLLGQANCLLNLGEIAFIESDNNQARNLFQQAQPLYQQTGDLLGQANCLLNLGKIAFIESDNNQARNLFQQAQPLYQQTGDLLGQANCLLNLGEIAFIESDNNQARNLFQQAQPLYQQTGDLLGQANCLLNLGKIAFRESDNNQARNLFQQAQPLYQRINARYSQAFTHAWLARVTTGEERTEHRLRMDKLAEDLGHDWLKQQLHDIADD